MGSSKTISIADAAKRLKISSRTLRRWIQAGYVPADVSPTGRYRIYERDIRAEIFRKLEAAR